MIKSLRGRASKKPLIFSVPGSKTYINDYYKNTPNSFLNISITGSRCSLQCKHCRGSLLGGMLEARTSGQLTHIVSKYSNGQLEGILVSGGFDKNGVLPLENVLEGIKKIKEENSLLKIYVHAGFVTEGMAQGLADAGVDGVLINVISSQNAIENVYNLRDRTPEDYYGTIRTLKRSGLKPSPHIIVGIDHGRIRGEFEAVEKVVELGVDSVVFAMLKKASSKVDFGLPDIRDDEVAGLVQHAKHLDPDLPISFGCARQPGPGKSMLEIELVKLGIDSIAFPAEETIRFALKNKIAHTFTQKCCAIF